METAGLVALALALGIAVGAGIATVIVLAAHTGRRAVAVQSVVLPSGIEAIIDVLETPAVLIDPSGSLVTASAAAEDAGFLDDGVHPELRAIAAEVRASGDTVRRELELRRTGRPDSVRHLSVTASLVGARYVLVAAEDRSESIRLDEVRRDFVANVSHELKTPIGAVSLLAEAIDSAAEDPEQVRRFAVRLAEESRRLADMTHDIIELSRVQGLEPLAQSEPVSIDRIVRTAIEQNHVRAEAKGIELVSRNPRVRLMVLGHELTLVAAVANLVSNAVQYSPDLRALLPQRPGPQSKHGRLRPGARDRQARRREPRRHRPPLVEARERVDVHDHPAAARDARRAARHRHPRRGHAVTRILIVEDEAALAEPLEYLLTREGYATEVAADGQSALASFLREPPDLVLLDLMLPGISGVDVCRELRTRSQVPIIMLTAKDSEVDIVVGLELGADDYVTKPYSSRELLARIKAVLRRRVEPDEDPGILEAGPVRMDIDRHVVSVDGRDVAMPLKEFELLELLMRNAGRVLTRGQLIDRVWGSDYFGDTKTLDVHIKRIRSKIEAVPSEPRLLVTVRGLGYRFDA